MRVTLAAALLVLSAATAAAAGAPTLRVVDETPLVVRGSAFKSGEKVRVWLVLTSSRRYRDAVAGSAGGFTVRFTVTPTQCAHVRSLTGVGSRGSRTTRALRLDCMPPPPLSP